MARMVQGCTYKVYAGANVAVVVVAAAWVFTATLFSFQVTTMVQLIGVEPVGQVMVVIGFEFRIILFNAVAHVCKSKAASVAAPQGAAAPPK
jgi:hypothetical protein